MQWNLEVVPVTVDDVDRAKAFYSDQVGFRLDLDVRVGEEMRIVQLTPPDPTAASSSGSDPLACTVCSSSSTMSMWLAANSLSAAWTSAR